MKHSMVVAVLVALASPLLAQKVSVEYAHQVDVSKFATYRWGKNRGQLADTAEDEHIKSALDRVLQAKGLRRVDSQMADLILTYQATVKDQQQVDTYVDDDDLGLGGWGWGFGWGPGWGDFGTDYTAQSLVNVRKGDLLVDIFDPRTNRMLFRGYSTGAFHSNPIKEDKLMSKAIDKMFKGFPPKAKD